MIESPSDKQPPRSLSPLFRHTWVVSSNPAAPQPAPPRANGGAHSVAYRSILRSVTLAGAVAGLASGLLPGCRQASPLPQAPPPDERRGAIRQAASSPARFLIAAGDNAMEAGDLVEAKRLYERVLAVSRKPLNREPVNRETPTHEASTDVEADLPEPADLESASLESADFEPAVAEGVLAHDRLGVLAERLGALGDARDHYQRALDLQQVAADGGSSAPLQARLAGVLRQLGDYASAEAAIHLALAEINPDRDPASAATVMRQLGRLRVADGHREEGVSALATAATLFERAGLASELGTTRLERGQVLLAMGDPRHAVGELSRAHSLFARVETLGRTRATESIAALEGLAGCYEQIEQSLTALTFRERAVQRALAQPDRTLTSGVLTRAIAAATAAGDADRAVAWSEALARLDSESR